MTAEEIVKKIKSECMRYIDEHIKTQLTGQHERDAYLIGVEDGVCNFIVFLINKITEWEKQK